MPTLLENLRQPCGPLSLFPSRFLSEGGSLSCCLCLWWEFYCIHSVLFACGFLGDGLGLELPGALWGGSSVECGLRDHTPHPIANILASEFSLYLTACIAYSSFPVISVSLSSCPFCLAFPPSCMALSLLLKLPTQHLVCDPVWTLPLEVLK